MTMSANSARGEATLAVDGQDYLLRPTFEALVAAEEELGSLFSVVEQAAEGGLTIAQIAGLFWHCLPAQDRPERSKVGAAVLHLGLVDASKPLRIVLSQIIKGTR